MGYKIWVTVPGHCYIIKLLPHHKSHHRNRPLKNHLTNNNNNINEQHNNDWIKNKRRTEEHFHARCYRHIKKIKRHFGTSNGCSCKCSPQSLNIIVSLRTNQMVKTVINCFHQYELPFSANRLASEKRYAIPCFDVFPLLRLLCSFFSGTCYVDADKVFLTSAFAFEVSLSLQCVFLSMSSSQHNYDKLIDVTLKCYVEAIKVFHYVDNIEDLSPVDLAAAAAVDTASLGIESAVQVVGSVAAGAAISAIMDVAVSSATIYLAKRKKDEGSISDKEFTTKVKKILCKSSLKFVGGTTGSIIGQLAIPVPIVGALVGGLCGSLIGTGIGMGINYGVIDRLEKKENDSKLKSITKPASCDGVGNGGDKPLYKKLVKLKVTKMCVFNERERRFEEKLFTQRRPDTKAGTSSPKRELILVPPWKKKLNEEEEEELRNKTPMLIVRRMKKELAKRKAEENAKTSDFFQSFRFFSDKTAIPDQNNNIADTPTTDTDTQNILDESESSGPLSLSPGARVKVFRVKYGENVARAIQEDRRISESVCNDDSCEFESNNLRRTQSMKTTRPKSVHQRFSLNSIKRSLRSLSFSLNDSSSSSSDNENETRERKNKSSNDENEKRERKKKASDDKNINENRKMKASDNESENGDQVTNSDDEEKESQEEEPKTKIVSDVGNIRTDDGEDDEVFMENETIVSEDRGEAMSHACVMNSARHMGQDDMSISSSPFKKINMETLKKTFQSFAFSEKETEKLVQEKNELNNNNIQNGRPNPLMNDYRILMLEDEFAKRVLSEDSRKLSRSKSMGSARSSSVTSGKNGKMRRRKRSLSAPEQQMRKTLNDAPKEKVQEKKRSWEGGKRPVHRPSCDEGKGRSRKAFRTKRTASEGEDMKNTRSTEFAVRRLFNSFGKGDGKTREYHQ